MAKILVYLSKLEFSGNTINAIDLVSGVKDLGHDVSLVAAPGPLSNTVIERELPWKSVNIPRRPRPSPHALQVLWSAAREGKFDLVHSYGEYPCLEAFCSLQVARGLPMLGTVMSMEIPAWLPSSIPLTVGTPQLQRSARRDGPVLLLEPPVDTDMDGAPVGVAEFRSRHGIGSDLSTVVVVSRLVRPLKLEGLERAISAMEIIARKHSARLVLVGGGPFQQHLSDLAAGVNGRLHRPSVILTGPMRDPRPAYAVADVVIGMGGSALRGMAFAKPTIVVGEQGFSAVVSAETVQRFQDEGFYGLGDGDRDPGRLAEDILAVLRLGPDERRKLGQFGRQVVEERYSLRVAAGRLADIYENLAGRSFPRRQSIPEAIESTARMLWLQKLRPRLQVFTSVSQHIRT